MAVAKRTTGKYSGKYSAADPVFLEPPEGMSQPTGILFYMDFQVVDDCIGELT